MRIFIKNMVCNRCKTAVQIEFTKAEIPVLSLKLGEVETSTTVSNQKLETLSRSLKKLGFEIIDNKKSTLIHQIKTEIIGLVHHSEEIQNQKLSVILAEKFPYEYTYISNLFSETEGTTIEKFFIAQRIEKVKELLAYNELSLSQIANQLGYSSVAYLSSQFKKNTGVTPTFFRLLKHKKRQNLDEIS